MSKDSGEPRKWRSRDPCQWGSRVASNERPRGAARYTEDGWACVLNAFGFLTDFLLFSFLPLRRRPRLLSSLSRAASVRLRGRTSFFHSLLPLRCRQLFHSLRNVQRLEPLEPGARDLRVIPGLGGGGGRRPTKSRSRPRCLQSTKKGPTDPFQTDNASILDTASLQKRISLHSRSLGSLLPRVRHHRPSPARPPAAAAPSPPPPPS